MQFIIHLESWLLSVSDNEVENESEEESREHSGIEAIRNEMNDKFTSSSSVCQE